MYHSVDFIALDGSWSANSYTYFHMVPDGRPTIATPSPITNYIDVPGASGQLDMSESLTGYPLYGNREGSLTFIVLNDYVDGGDTWSDRYQKLCYRIHGKRLKMILEDDPQYYYEGRFSVDSWESPNENGNSTVTISYVLDPYKYKNTIIYMTTSVSAGNPMVLYFGTMANPIGHMPVVPEFQISNISDPITIELENPEIYSSKISHTVSTSATYQFPDMILTDINGTNQSVITIKGTGNVVVRMRPGEL